MIQIWLQCHIKKCSNENKYVLVRETLTHVKELTIYQLHLVQLRDPTKEFHLEDHGTNSIS